MKLRGIAVILCMAILATGCQQTGESEKQPVNANAAASQVFNEAVKPASFGSKTLLYSQDADNLTLVEQRDKDLLVVNYFDRAGKTYMINEKGLWIDEEYSEEEYQMNPLNRISAVLCELNGDTAMDALLIDCGGNYGIVDAIVLLQQAEGLQLLKLLHTGEISYTLTGSEVTITAEGAEPLTLSLEEYSETLEENKDNINVYVRTLWDAVAFSEKDGKPAICVKEPICLISNAGVIAELNTYYTIQDGALVQHSQELVSLVK